MNLSNNEYLFSFIPHKEKFQLTEDTSTGSKKIMTKLRNHTSRVHPVTKGLCFLKFPYLYSRYTANNKASENSPRSSTGALKRDFPSSILVPKTNSVLVFLVDMILLCEFICLRHYEWRPFPQKQILQMSVRVVVSGVCRCWCSAIPFSLDGDG